MTSFAPVTSAAASFEEDDDDADDADEADDEEDAEEEEDVAPNNEDKRELEGSASSIPASVGARPRIDSICATVSGIVDLLCCTACSTQNSSARMKCVSSVARALRSAT